MAFGIDDAVFASLISGLVATGANAFSQHSTNKKNLDIDQRNFDYTVAQNELTRQREDTAHQREVADLQAAGLSPLASLGGANSTPVSSVSSFPSLTPLNFSSGASQLLAQYSEGLRDIWKVKTGERRADVQNAFDESMENLRHVNAMEEQAARLESQEKVAGEQITSQEKIAEGQQSTQKEVAKMNNAQSEANAIRQQATAFKQLSSNVSLTDKRLTHEQSMAIMQNFQEIGVQHFEFKSDAKAVKMHNDAVMARYRDFQNKNLNLLGKSSQSTSFGASFGAGVNKSNFNSKDYGDKYDALNKSFWSDPKNDIWICNSTSGSNGSRVRFSTGKRN